MVIQLDGDYSVVGRLCRCWCLVDNLKANLDLVCKFELLSDHVNFICICMCFCRDKQETELSSLSFPTCSSVSSRIKQIQFASSDFCQEQIWISNSIRKLWLATCDLQLATFKLLFGSHNLQIANCKPATCKCKFKAFASLFPLLSCQICALQVWHWYLLAFIQRELQTGSRKVAIRPHTLPTSRKWAD